MHRSPCFHWSSLLKATAATFIVDKCVRSSWLIFSYRCLSHKSYSGERETLCLLPVVPHSLPNAGLVLYIFPFFFLLPLGFILYL